MSNNKCDHYADHDDYHNADDYNHRTNGPTDAGPDTCAHIHPVAITDPTANTVADTSADAFSNAVSDPKSNNKPDTFTNSPSNTIALGSPDPIPDRNPV